MRCYCGKEHTVLCYPPLEQSEEVAKAWAKFWEMEKATAEAERWCPDGVVHFIEHPEHYSWRLDRDIPQEQPFYITPTDTRCPRCYSINLTIGYPAIRCNACGYSEALIDYPISHDFHALFQQQEGRRLPVDINPSSEQEVCQKRQIEAVGCLSCYHHTMGFCACREQADVESNGRGCHDWIRR